MTDRNNDEQSNWNNNSPKESVAIVIMQLTCEARHAGSNKALHWSKDLIMREEEGNNQQQPTEQQ
jgi:hypothetical protein